MIAYPDIDPIALQLGPVKIHWYGLMYLLGFATSWWLGRVRAKDPRRNWSGAAVDDLLFYIAPLVATGIAYGRIGNFINGNLWGGPSDLPWAMVFPDPRAGGLPRHPSQLYQALLEGFTLFAIVWIYSRHPRPTMAVSGLFLAGYGVLRFPVEFIRVPDAHIGYLAFDWLTMGQVLSAPMIIAGALLMWLAYRWAPDADTTPPTMPARSRRSGTRKTRR